MVKNKERRGAVEKFLERMPSSEERIAAEKLIGTVEDYCGWAEPGKVGVSLRYPTRVGWEHPISVAWLYPGDTGWSKTRQFSFGYRTQGDGPDNLPAEVQLVLQSWAESFDTLAYAHHVSARNVEAWVVSRESAVRHTEELAARLSNIMVMLSQVQGGG